MPADTPLPRCPLVYVPQVTTCDPAELTPLVEWLQTANDDDDNLPRVFARGTALPDGRLDLCKQSIGPGGLARTLGALRDGRPVRHLLLGTNGLGDDGARTLANHAAASESLHTLYLGCNMIHAPGAEALADAVAGNPQVSALWLKRNPLGEDGAAVIAGLVARTTTLQVLDVDNTMLGDAGCARVLDALADNASIRHVYLGSNGAGPQAARAAAAMLSRNRTLQSLYLGASELRDDGIRELIAGGLTRNTTLDTLVVSSNRIGAYGLALLADAPASSIALRSLDLGVSSSALALQIAPNHYGDAGAAHLAAWLRRDPPGPAIAELDLRDSGITSRGAQLLASALEDDNRRLATLRLGKGIARTIRRRIATALAGRPAPRELPAHLAAIQSVYRMVGGRVIHRDDIDAD
ncbi:MAG: gala protein [Planctomycetota bacterium]